MRSGICQPEVRTLDEISGDAEKQVGQPFERLAVTRRIVEIRTALQKISKLCSSCGVEHLGSRVPEEPGTVTLHRRQCIHVWKDVLKCMGIRS